MTLPNPFPPHINTIGVFAAAGVPNPEKVSCGLRKLAEWGLRAHFPDASAVSNRFLAGTDEERANRFNALLKNAEIDCLLAARGGYGCGRILDLIDWAALLGRQIPIIGYSDITAIHLAAYGKGCRSCVAGPMLAGAFSQEESGADNSPKPQVALASLGQMLSGTPVNHALSALHEGAARGPLIPANLAVLTSLVGTPHLPDLSNCILVIEDVGEAAYRVDRYLNQLNNAGVLKRLGGLIMGQFTDCEDEEWLPEVFADFAERIPGPVGRGLPFGHAFPSISLPVGTPAILKADGCHASLQIGF